MESDSTQDGSASEADKQPVPQNKTVEKISEMRYYRVRISSLYLNSRHVMRIEQYLRFLVMDCFLIVSCDANYIYIFEITEMSRIHCENVNDDMKLLIAWSAA